MDEFEDKPPGFNKFSAEIRSLLDSKADLPVPLECNVLNRLIRNNANVTILAELSVPLGIRRLVAEKIEVSRQIRKFESIKMGYCAPALELRSKHEAITYAIRIYIEYLLKAIPLLVQTLGHQDFSYNFVANWELLFFRNNQEKKEV